MPGWLDVALVVLFAAVWPLSEYFWIWPRHVRAVERGEPDARSRAYVKTTFLQWTLAALVLALTFSFGRSLSTLGLGALGGWRLALGVSLSVAYGVLIVVQGRMLANKPAALPRLRAKLGPLRPLIP